MRIPGASFIRQFDLFVHTTWHLDDPYKTINTERIATSFYKQNQHT